MKLLANGDSNTKLRKNKKSGVKTFGLSLSPSTESGVGNTCPHASAGCKAACLDHQGMAAVFAAIREARKKKTRFFYQNRKQFIDILRKEIQNKIKNNPDSLIAIRLNVFSDFPWETTGIIDEFPNVQFYDYTKNPKRVGRIRPNYWVTFSRSEENEDNVMKILADGKNVAVVFADSTVKGGTGKTSANQELPKKWRGFEVIDGDTTDLRFDDKRGRKHGKVVGLRLKAFSKLERSQAIDSGFAIVWK